MARKRKTPAARLRLEIERVRNSNRLRIPIRQADPPDWTDNRVREAHANAVLSLFDIPADAPVRKAFQAFGLDPIDPFNWRLLLMGLAAIFFARAARPRGARPKWNEHRRMLFETDVARARKRVKEIFKRHGAPPPGDDDVAAYLKHKLPDRYGSITDASIRKYIVSGPPKGKR
jgi:hypothetical protein